VGSTQRRGTDAVDTVLLVVALLLAAAVVLGAVVVLGERGRPGAGSGTGERYAAVMAAAEAEADALVNVSHDDPDSVARVVAGATGDLATRYADSGEVLRSLRRQRAVADGSVVAVGVVAVGPTSATVLAATEGTLATRASQGRPRDRDARLRLQLVLEDGRWLTRAVEVLD
jgi:Mce-associated membrane protein